MTEVMTTSETGGSKGQKPSQLSNIDPLALLALGEVAGFGARKYAAFNYLNGYPWNLNVDAAFRHLLLMWAGEDYDNCPEDCDEERDDEGKCKSHSGLLHALHFAWHGLALASFAIRQIGEDNRFRQQPEQEEGYESDDKPSEVWDLTGFLAEPLTMTFEVADINPELVALLFGQHTTTIAESTDREDH